MTPLAQRIVKELALPERERTYVDHAGVLGEMSNVRCFEVTEILDAVKAVLTTGISEADGGSEAMGERVAEIAGQTSFLPAPKTWIEWAGGGARIGFLLQADEGADFAFVRMVSYDPTRTSHPVRSADFAYTIGLAARGGSPNHYHASRDLTPAEEQDVGDFTATLHGVLAFINARRMIGRQDHGVHKGLQKRLSQAGADVVLHPWTEIKLSVSPSAAGGEEAVGERLIGQRALHFCRSHLRLRRGRLEIVRAHWRGDAALGMKQTRYRVTDEGAA